MRYRSRDRPKPGTGGTARSAILSTCCPAAKHDVLVISDSDVHVAPDYLGPVGGSFWSCRGPASLRRSMPGCLRGAGWRAGSARRSRLGFLPGALMARALGRQDCLGATMMLRRKRLTESAACDELASHLADDNVLGRFVRKRGISVRLAGTVPATTVPEETLIALFRTNCAGRGPFAP